MRSHGLVRQSRLGATGWSTVDALRWLPSEATYPAVVPTAVFLTSRLQTSHQPRGRSYWASVARAQLLAKRPGTPRQRPGVGYAEAIKGHGQGALRYGRPKGRSLTYVMSVACTRRSERWKPTGDCSIRRRTFASHRVLHSQASLQTWWCKWWTRDRTDRASW